MASSRALSITELVEMICLRLPLRDAVFFRQLSKGYKELIDSSRALQSALCLAAPPEGALLPAKATINEFLVAAFCSSGCSFFLRPVQAVPRDMPGTEREYDPFLRFEFQVVEDDNERAQERPLMCLSRGDPNDPRHRMFVTFPPVQAIRLRIYEESSTRTIPWADFLLVDLDGVKMGLVADAVRFSGKKNQWEKLYVQLWVAELDEFGEEVLNLDEIEERYRSNVVDAKVIEEAMEEEDWVIQDAMAALKEECV